MNSTNETAFEARLSGLRAWLVLLARMHLDFRHQQPEASDLAQETLVDAVKYRQQLQALGDADLERWLRHVLRNKIVDFYRRHRHNIAADIHDSFLRLEELVIREETSPSGKLQRQEQLHWLANAIEQLSPQNREVLVLKDLLGWQLSDIAAQLNCTLGIVAGRLRRARQALQQQLDQHEFGN